MLMCVAPSSPKGILEQLSESVSPCCGILFHSAWLTTSDRAQDISGFSHEGRDEIFLGQMFACKCSVNYSTFPENLRDHNSRSNFLILWKPFKWPQSWHSGA